MNRTRSRIIAEIVEEQCGFVQDAGIYAIIMIKMLSDRAIEMQKKLFLCFIDCPKAFNKVCCKDLFESLGKNCFL